MINENDEIKTQLEYNNRTFLDKNISNILIITRGHPFERDPFFEMIDSTGYAWSHVEHPAAQEIFKTGFIENYKAIIFYDMPGINFETAPPKPTFFNPDKDCLLYTSPSPRDQ